MSESKKPSFSQDTDCGQGQTLDSACARGSSLPHVCDLDCAQDVPRQQSCGPDIGLGQSPQQTYRADDTQGQPANDSCSPKKLPVRRSQRIRPNGKRYFSARTVVYPIVFLVVYFLTQLLAAGLASTLAMNAYMASDSFDLFMDDMSLDMVQHFFRDVAVRAILYSTPLQIIVYGVFLWYQKRKDRQYLLVRPIRSTVFPLGFATAIGCVGIATLMLQLFDILAKNSTFWQNMIINYQQSTEAVQGADLLLTTLAVSILVPIAEELLFRGIITEEIRRVAPDWVAILLGGIIFALVHGNLVQILYVLPLGLLLGAAYIWSNSIWVPILMHVVFNFFGSIVSTLFGENQTGLTVYTVFIFVMIPVGIFSSFIMNRMYRKNKGRVSENASRKVDCVNAI